MAFVHSFPPPVDAHARVREALVEPGGKPDFITTLNGAARADFSVCYALRVGFSHGHLSVMPTKPYIT